jgi:hypothetical protein
MNPKLWDSSGFGPFFLPSSLAAKPSDYHRGEPGALSTNGHESLWLSVKTTIAALSASHTLYR